MKITRVGVITTSLSFAILFPPLWLFIVLDIVNKNKVLRNFFPSEWYVFLLPGVLGLMIPLFFYNVDKLSEPKTKIKNSLISFLIILVIGGVLYISILLHEFIKVLSGITGG